MLLVVVIQYHSKSQMKTYKSRILSYGDIMLFIIFRHKKEVHVTLYAYKTLFETGNYCPVRRRFG